MLDEHLHLIIRQEIGFDIFFHPDSGTSEWLSILDSWFAHKLIEDFEAPTACEIGVWKGAWTISQLLNNHKLTVVGIDPYPGLDKIYSVLEFNLKHYDVYARFSLYPDVENMPQTTNALQFSIVHIDGVHSEDSVINDLNFACNHLSHNGIIVIDDIYHPEFPGVTSAAFKFLHSSEFASFALTENKMYICRNIEYPEIFEKCRNILKNNSIYFSEGFSGISGAEYVQSNAINGYKQLVIRPNIRDLAKFYRIIELENMSSPNTTLRRQVKEKLKIPKINNKLKQLFA
jgi:hypothetical protein